MKKLLKSIHPNKLFNKRSPSITKSQPTSFASSYSSGSSSSDSSGLGPARTRSARSEPWAQQAFKITKDELELAIKRVMANAPALTEEEVIEMIKEIDEEELGAVGSVVDPTDANEDELKGAFGFFDVDKDGKITVEELHAGFIALGDSKCTLEECKRMIESVDSNRDGFVCFQDFRRMMISSR